MHILKFFFLLYYRERFPGDGEASDDLDDDDDDDVIDCLEDDLAGGSEGMVIQFVFKHHLMKPLTKLLTSIGGQNVLTQSYSNINYSWGSVYI